MRLGGIMRLKLTRQTRRTLWLNQLRAAEERAKKKFLTKYKNPTGRTLTRKETEEFIAFERKQGARQALIELLEDEGTLEESLRLTVEYYAQEL